LPLFSSAVIFAPQNKVQGAEASKISKEECLSGFIEMLKISDLNYDWKLSDIDKVQKNNLKVFSFFVFV
jgi:hypothetical protein